MFSWSTICSLYWSYSLKWENAACTSFSSRLSKSKLYPSTILYSPLILALVLLMYSSTLDLHSFILATQHAASDCRDCKVLLRNYKFKVSYWISSTSDSNLCCSLAVEYCWVIDCWCDMFWDGSTFKYWLYNSCTRFRKSCTNLASNMDKFDSSFLAMSANFLVNLFSNISVKSIVRLSKDCYPVNTTFSLNKITC